MCVMREREQQDHVSERKRCCCRVTRWLDYFFIFGHFQQRIIAGKHKNLPNWVLNIAKYKITHKNLPKVF